VIVVDASAVLELILGSDGARAVAARFSRTPESLHAPHLLDLEVTQVLRRFVARSEISADRAWHGLAAFRDTPITRHAHEPFLDRIWDLRHAMTAYDASYVALAEALNAPLVTCDARLAGSRGHAAEIELV